MAKRYIPSYDEFITESFRDKFREFKDAWSEMRKEMDGEPIPEPVTKELWSDGRISVRSTFDKEDMTIVFDICEDGEVLMEMYALSWMMHDGASVGIKSGLNNLHYILHFDGTVPMFEAIAKECRTDFMYDDMLSAENIMETIANFSEDRNGGVVVDYRR